MSKELCVIFGFIISVVSAYGEHNIRIGGLFHTGSEDDVAMFETVVAESNGYLDEAHRMDPASEMVPKMNAFHVSHAVCRLLQTGVAGIVGPNSATTAPHVQSVCDTKEIPHLETRWDYPQRRGGCSVNLHPYPASFYRALIAMIHAWGWKSFAIVYEKEYALSAMTEVVQLANEEGYSIMLNHLEKGDDYRSVLREVQRAKFTNIVLDCSLGILPEVLKQAQQVGIMVAEYNYIITNLDLHTLDLDFLMHAGTNITGLRMVAFEDKHPTNPKSTPMLLETALIYDAVGLFTAAWKSMSEANISTVQPLNCSAVDSWAHGYTLINLMKASEVKGYTGLIKFDHQGFRSDFQLNLFELDGGIKEIGTWNLSQNLNISRANLNNWANDDLTSVVNRTFVVSIALAEPYGYEKESQKQLYGNDRYEGFGVDVIKALSDKLGFNYTFVVQEDGVYGSLNQETKQWNGMLREIMDGRVDLGICDLTITHEREKAVDFTTPFMNLGISILYKKPQKEAPSLFSFLSPFSMDVWMCMLAAYIGVSVLLFVMARISPYEWTNPYPCIEEPEVLENQFSLKNSLWFTIGSLMQQGSEIAPIAVSTRMVAGIWWFFTLIMVSSYTANLAAFLTVEPLVEPFKDVYGLQSNTKGIKYGAKGGGSTFTFFRDSAKEVHNKMYEYMSKNPSVMVKTNEEGRLRCENEDYAYLMESTSIEYITERHCNLTQVGGLMDSKGYGIAMRKNAPYRNALSTGVLHLQEQGILTELKRKWWKEKKGGGACAVNDASQDASELSLDNVGGVFVVLVGGIFIACFITIFEMLYNINTVTKESKVAFKDELMEELRFVAQCHGSTKPVRNRVSSEDSEEEVYQPIPVITSFDGWFDRNDKKTPLP